MEFNHKTMTIAIKQFFGPGVSLCADQDFSDREDTYVRWATFCELLLESGDELSPLWGNLNFRQGYQVAEHISRILDRDRKLNAWEFIENNVGDSLQFTCKDPVESINSLIEGAKLLISAEDRMEEHYSLEKVHNVLKDLKVMLVIAKIVAEFRKTLDTHSEELEQLMLGEQKPLKKAA